MIGLVVVGVLGQNVWRWAVGGADSQLAGKKYEIKFALAVIAMLWMMPVSADDHLIGAHREVTVYNDGLNSI